MRVLIIGLGSIARRHVAALKKIDPDTAIFALRSSDRGKSLPGVTDIHSLEGTEAFDFVIISNPTSCHADTIREMLPLDLPLFIEKPLFASLDNEDILEQIRRRGTISYVACNMRFLDCLRFVKTAVEGKRVNEVNVYCGSYLPEWRPGSAWRECYSARPELGGGVHIDLIHELDYVHWIFGDPCSCRKTLRHSSSLGIEACDYANYCLEYPGFCVSVVLNYFRRDYKRTMEIVFDDRTWTVDLAQNRISDEKGDIIFQSDQDDDSMYENQMKYFISLLDGHNDYCSNDAFEAFQVLKLCL